jgi:hypothetical protein
MSCRLTELQRKAWARQRLRHPMQACQRLRLRLQLRLLQGPWMRLPHSFRCLRSPSKSQGQ